MSVLEIVVIIGLLIIFGVVAFSWLIINSKEEDKHGGKGV